MNQLFSQEFWLSTSENLIQWFLQEFWGLLILAITLFTLSQLVKFSLAGIKKKILQRSEKEAKSNTQETEKRLNTLFGILRGLVKVVFYTIFIMVFLTKLQVNIGPILTGAGIIGLAVGFGAQELVRDFISGFFILLENQVRTGDVAIINGTGGLVEKIELRTITLRDNTGTVHVFQNGKITSLSNMTKDWSAMVFDIGVAYKEDVNKVIQIMKMVGDELQQDPDFAEKILEPIEIYGLDNFGDSAIVIKGRIKTKPIMQWGVGREYRKRLKYAFDAEKIEIPFPHTTVYWGEEIQPLKLELDVKQ